MFLKKVFYIKCVYNLAMLTSSSRENTTRDENFFILLVLDNGTKRQNVEQAIQKTGVCNIIVSKNIHKFLEENSDETIMPWLILYDLDNTENNIDTILTVKRNERLQHSPLFVLTSDPNEPAVDECLCKGVNSYIQKPITVEKMRRAMILASYYWNQTQ